MAKVQEGIVYGGYRNVYSCVFHGTMWGDNGSCKQCDAEDRKFSGAATPLTNTDWQDEPTEPSGKRSETTTATATELEASVRKNGISPLYIEPMCYCAIHDTTTRLAEPCPGCMGQMPKRTPADILSEAINRAEAMLPHGIELRCERNMATRTHDVTATCPHCGKSELVVAMPDGYLKGATAGCTQSLIRQCVDQDMRSCIEATCCDPLDRWVDGLRVRECLEHWLRNIREFEVPSTGGFGPRLTDLQLATAQSAWSSQLRAKQQEAREKERAQVVVERDEDGE